ncbi:MAG: HPr kinase/phosphorylase [Paracoccaceae bacterium]
MPAPLVLHATTIAFDGKGILLTGASGSGKSSLALQLMAIGASLVADDRTVLTKQEDMVVASSPATIAGLIEARGVGILRVDFQAQAAVSLVVDMDQIETDRLPALRSITILGQRLALVLGSKSPHFPAALKHLAFQGRWG